MTNQELDVVNKLKDAYNKFITLPAYTEQDTRLFADKINDLQAIVMSRDAVRKHPKIFKNNSNEDK